MTNNKAEYKTLLLGLREAKALGAHIIIIKSDSRLIDDHIDKSF